jgi:hypothetical protein
MYGPHLEPGTVKSEINIGIVLGLCRYNAEFALCPLKFQSFISLLVLLWSDKIR